METMTTDKCLEQIKEAVKKRDEMIDRAREFYRKRAQSVLNEWAYDNRRFDVCDILEFNGSMIEVDRITGRMFAPGKPYVAYQGPVLTKQMKYRKDRERKEFYDDGRDIKLVKKAQKGE